MSGHRVTLELDDLEEGRSRNRCYDSYEGGSGGESDLESQVRRLSQKIKLFLSPTLCLRVMGYDLEYDIFVASLAY